tara:strand:- start:133 stop:774 length:642 start_codon:yes stop_codon:yes gene_type:complete
MNYLESTLFEELDYRQESVRNFEVEPVTIQFVRKFVENWHYSSNVNGLRISNVFGLFYNNNLIGSIIYGALGMANTWKGYGEKEEDVVELKRLCCIDNTPKNTESYFIGNTLRWLKKNTPYKTVVSYADPFYGHEGTIYKASNFKHCGMTSKGRVIEYGDKIYHEKCIRNYYIDKDGNKQIKHYAKKIINCLENGEAKYIQTPGKHIYVYSLK